MIQFDAWQSFWQSGHIKDYLSYRTAEDIAREESDEQHGQRPCDSGSECGRAG